MVDRDTFLKKLKEIMIAKGIDLNTRDPRLRDQAWDATLAYFGVTIEQLQEHARKKREMLTGIKEQELHLTKEQIRDAKDLFSKHDWN